MRIKLLIPVFVLFCLAFAVHASANAFIVADTLAPEGQHALRVEAASGKFIKYSVDVEPAKTYTLSFYYRVVDGQFTFSFQKKAGGLIGDISKSYSSRDWTRVEYTFTTDGSPGDDNISVELRFTGNEDGRTSVFLLDAIQLEPAPEATKFNDFKHQAGCCPFDFCYTGGLLKDNPECVHDDFYELNVSQPPLGYDLASFGGNSPTVQLLHAKSGYRCINGSWKFSRPKFTPLHDHAGFCPDDSQCFIYAGGNPDASVACVNNGTFHMYSAEGAEADSYYCFDGNWTTRTKEIALQLLDMAGPDDTYTLFCDRFDRSLNPDHTRSFWRDYVGDNIAGLLTPDLVNEFCVLDLDGQIIAGVSLNPQGRQINESKLYDSEKDCVLCTGMDWLADPPVCDSDGCKVGATLQPQPKSFMEMLKGPDDVDYCDSVISDPGSFDGLYHQCRHADVFYNPKLQTVIFTKPQDVDGSFEAVPFKTQESFISRVFARLKGIIRRLLGVVGVSRSVSEGLPGAQLDFVRNAGSFNRLYISYAPDGPEGHPREIRGIIETKAHLKLDDSGVEMKSFLNIQYRNYRVPVCRYFFKHNFPHLQKQISKDSSIYCSPLIEDPEDWVYSVYVENPRFGDIGSTESFASDSDLIPVREWTGAADTFWNDMTAKIRTQDSSEFDDRFSGASAPAVPEFSFAPADNPVAGAPIEFTLLSEPAAGERFIAVTWDFNDSFRSTSAFNVTTKHRYSEAGVYHPKVCIMNQFYKISCAEQELDVNVGPAVTINEMPQTNDGELCVNLSFTSGNAPANFIIDWHDGLDSSYQPTTVAGALINVTPWMVYCHSYSFGNAFALDPWIGVVGSDRDGAPFDNQKQLVVRRTISGTKVNITLLPQLENQTARINVSFSGPHDFVFTVDWHDTDQSKRFDSASVGSQMWGLFEHNYTFGPESVLSPEITIFGSDGLGDSFSAQQTVSVDKEV